MKINIVVDHPDRDLDGMLILKNKLEAKNIYVTIIPYYFINKIFLSPPNMVIFPHYRKEFFGHLNLIRKSNILIAILDTEGGFFSDSNGFNYYLKNVYNSISKVDLYFLWGQLHFKNLIKLNPKKKNFYLTGNPRYDLLSKKYLKISKKPNIFSKKVKNILINTTFNDVHPRFQTLGQETENSIKYYNKKPTFMLKQNHMRLLQKNKFIKIIKLIIRNFKNCKIIIRPHPFEDDAQYKAIKEKNVCISNKGSIVNFLKYADVIVQHNCTSAFESFMLKNYSLSLSLINSNNSKHNQAIDGVSIQIPNENDLIKNIKFKLRSKKYPGNIKIKNGQKIIENLFFKIDGKISERISNIIYQKLDKKLKKIEVKIHYAFYPYTIKNFFVSLLKIFLKEKNFLLIKSFVKRKNYLIKDINNGYIKKFDNKILNI